MKKKEELCSLQGNQQSAVSFMAKLHELHEFKGHPFKVENDRALFELMKSIEENGVLVPLIVRKHPENRVMKLLQDIGEKQKSDSKVYMVDKSDSQDVRYGG